MPVSASWDQLSPLAEFQCLPAGTNCLHWQIARIFQPAPTVPTATDCHSLLAGTSCPRWQTATLPEKLDWMAASKFILDAAIQFKLWPGRLATEFELVSNSLGGAHPGLNWMATSNINLDAAIQARFSASAKQEDRDPSHTASKAGSDGCI
ncbi:hypothetical protein PCASD_26273 [Puccinia coronata f. sp. avenae]|uniref:Uncharacterized protein n=1 Tax=Puccinia coronata f. sp. avenae TaxID=200324 RepID=A0A2N5TH39_9BASI|nr:hypothetical protein PCASD_26273 [Puccinia coronata f. sp. avenae]